MANFNIKKYGWIADPENNFSDDGNYFYAYKWATDPRFTATKLCSDGDIYFSVKFQSMKSGFYKYFDKLNGVNKDYAIEHLDELLSEINNFKFQLDVLDVIQTIPDEVRNNIINACKTITTNKAYGFVREALAANGLDRDKMDNQYYAEFYKECINNTILPKDSYRERYRDFMKYVMKQISNYGSTKEKVMEMMDKYFFPNDYPEWAKKEIREKVMEQAKQIMDIYYMEVE